MYSTWQESSPWWTVSHKHPCQKNIIEKNPRLFRGPKDAATSATEKCRLQKVTGDQLQRMAHMQPSLPASRPPQQAHQADAFDIYTAFNTSETGDLFCRRPRLEPSLDLSWPPRWPCSSALNEAGLKSNRGEKREREGWFSWTFSVADSNRRARGRQ